VSCKEIPAWSGPASVIGPIEWATANENRMLCSWGDGKLRFTDTERIALVPFPVRRYRARGVNRWHKTT
jgi:hypothetical protein